MFADLWIRLRSLVRRRIVERELADELQFHLDQSIDKHIASGMTRADAVRRARLEFGGAAGVADACRDARGVALIETVLQDIRYGLRTLRRETVFSITAILTLALGTASLATVASIGDTLLWRLPAAPHAETLVSVAAARGRAGEGPVSYPDYVAFRDRTTTLTALAAHYSTAPLFLALGGNAREVNGAVVSANYFSLLGMRPALGRFFNDDEDRVPDRDRVVVIGHDFWRSWFAASPSAIGATLTINRVPFTVVGVAPSRSPHLTPQPAELYIPAMMLRVGYRWCADALAAECTMLSMIGRLAPGRTVADAVAELPTIMPGAWRHAPIGENRGVIVREPRGLSEDDQEPRLVAMLAVASLVVLIVCCANLAGLLTARSAARQGEIAIRAALGAGPVRVIRQLVTESLLLAFAGGVCGLVLSRILVVAFARLFFAVDDEGHSLSYDFGQSSATAGAIMVTSLIAGLAFGLLPAIAAVRRSGRLTTRTTSWRSVTARWSTGRWLLASQAAVTVAMLATAALLATSARLVLQGRNYEPTHVALIRVRPRLVQYTPAQAQHYQREVIDRLRTIPSVESVTMVAMGTILSGGSTEVRIAEWPPDQRETVRYNEVGPAYFATLRTPLIAGREFDDRDGLHVQPVAIVNKVLADRLWPGGHVIGSSIIVGNVQRQVVGVVAEASVQGRTGAIEPWLFTPFWQNSGQIDSRIAVRTSGDPLIILPSIAREAHRVDPDVPIAETITLPQRLTALTRPVRVAAAFVGYTASLAMVLTAVGLYGALAFAVSRRTKEIGIRLTLGAGRAQVIGSIVWEGVAVVAAGALAGVVLAIAGARVISHLLYGSASADWMFFTGAAVAVTLVGLCASLIPASRAAAVEPVVVLRQD